MWLSMRMPWSHRGASAVSTHFVKVRGESGRLTGRTRYWYALPPKAHLRNVLWWGRMEMGSKCLLDLTSDLVWDMLKESILNFSRMFERFSWLRSKIGCNPPSFLETMKYGCRTRTLCREEGPPWWPRSSIECSLLVWLPEPARDPPAW